MGAPRPPLQARLVLIPRKSQPLQLVSLSVKAFPNSKALLLWAMWKEKGGVGEGAALSSRGALGLGFRREDD